MPERPIRRRKRRASSVRGAIGLSARFSRRQRREPRRVFDRNDARALHGLPLRSTEMPRMLAQLGAGDFAADGPGDLPDITAAASRHDRWRCSTSSRQAVTLIGLDNSHGLAGGAPTHGDLAREAPAIPPPPPLPYGAAHLPMLNEGLSDPPTRRRLVMWHCTLLFGTPIHRRGPALLRRSSCNGHQLRRLPLLH
jgi:hypothetical protein